MFIPPHLGALVTVFVHYVEFSILGKACFLDELTSMPCKILSCRSCFPLLSRRLYSKKRFVDSGHCLRDFMLAPIFFRFGWRAVVTSSRLERMSRSTAPRSVHTNGTPSPYFPCQERNPGRVSTWRRYVYYHHKTCAIFSHFTESIRFTFSYRIFGLRDSLSGEEARQTPPPKKNPQTRLLPKTP